MVLLKVLGGDESAQGLVWTNGGVASSRIAQPLRARIKLELCYEGKGPPGRTPTRAAVGVLELRAWSRRCGWGQADRILSIEVSRLLPG